MSVNEDMASVVYDEFRACAARDRLLEIDTMQVGWEHGLPIVPGQPSIAMGHDLTWWFLEHFAPEEFAMHRKVFCAIADFWTNLARLNPEPRPIDWHLIEAMQRWVRNYCEPSAYQVATRATDGDAGRAAAAIRRLHTEAQWRTKS